MLGFEYQTPEGENVQKFKHGYCCNTCWTFRFSKHILGFGSKKWHETFWHRHFIAIDISALGHFITSPWTFWQVDYSTCEFFLHKALSAPGHFSNETFWQMDISAKWTFQHSNTFLQRCQKLCSETSTLLCMHTVNSSD